MSTVKKQLVSGVFYTAVAKYAGIIISIIITGILSRLLTPEDFGTIVPVTVLVSFFTILGDIGIGPAIIQSNSLTKKDIDSIFTFTVIVGFLLAILFFLASWVIASIYSSDVLIVLCQILSVSLFFSCINVVPNALLYKGKKFRFLAKRSIVVQMIAGVTAITAAFLGAGLYALVVQSLISSICLFAISYRENILKFNPSKIDWKPLKQIRSFSSYQFLFDVLNYFSVNLDKLIITKYMGVAALGYYDKSYRLMQMPLQTIPYIITPVLHPIFSDMQNDLEKMRIYYSKVVRLVAFIGFPLSVLLFFTARDIIFILFGAQWEPSVLVFEFLSLSVGFQIILSTSGSIFQSAGRTHFLFLCGILSTFTIVVAIFVGIFVFQRLEVVGLFLSSAFVVNFFSTFTIMYCVLFRVNFWFFFRQILPSLFLSAGLAVVLWGVSQFMESWSVILSFVFKGSIAFVFVCLYLQFSGEYDIFRKASRLTGLFKK